MGYLDYMIKILTGLRNRGVLKQNKPWTKMVVNMTTNNVVTGMLDNKFFLKPLYGAFLMYSRYVNTF